MKGKREDGRFDPPLPLDCEAGTVSDYPCIGKGYRFTHTFEGVRGETYDLFPLKAEAGGKAAA